MKNCYNFILTFYDTYGTFDVEANSCDEAYDKAYEIIQKAIKNLPVEVEFSVQEKYDARDGVM